MHVEDGKSFLNVRDWINVIMDSSDKRVPIVLIGNKTDLNHLRAVSL